jgi:hypothetical protein
VQQPGSDLGSTILEGCPSIAEIKGAVTSFAALLVEMDRHPALAAEPLQRRNSCPFTRQAMGQICHWIKIER